jgi:hypothetical protein
VVQVRVSENEIVDGLRVDGQRLVIAVLQFLRALKNSAVYQQPLPGRLDQIPRTCNASRRAQKSEFCHMPVF